MKKFKSEKPAILGLKPLKNKEKKEINGGIGGTIFKWFFAAYCASVLSDTEGHAEAFREGYEKGLE
ncbi:MAG: hypothetical protein ACLFM7_09210 [Bacteroidales bacterium]